MSKSNHSTARWVTLLSIFVLNSGCSSLYNPYIDTSSLTYSEKNSSSGETETKIACSHKDIMIDDAMACGLALQSEYISAMGDQALLNSISGVSLFALAAYTTGLSIDGNKASRVTDAALGTTALYGMSQWLSTPSRSQIFGLGAKAVQCAIDTSNPFRAQSGQLEDFKKVETELSERANTLRVSLGTIENLLSTGAQFTKQQQVRAYAKASQQLLNDADAAITQAAKLLKLHHQAPYELMGAISTINATVNLGLVESIQSLNALPGALNSMMSMYSKTADQLTKFGISSGDGITKIISSNGNAQSYSDNNDSSFNNLQNDTDALANALAKMRPLIIQFQPDLPKQIAQTCGVNLEGIINPITLTPSDLEFDSDSAAMISTKASGGSGKYVASYDNAALEIKQDQPFGGTFQIKPRNGASGTYFVTIMDTNSKEKVLPVKVKQKQENAQGQQGQKGCESDAAKKESKEELRIHCEKAFPAGYSFSAAEQILCTDAAKTSNLQLKLKENSQTGSASKQLCPDGYYGPDTRNAILEMRKKDDNSIADTDPITEEQLNKIVETNLGGQ